MIWNLRLVTKAELKLYQATILDLRERLKKLESDRDHERSRAEKSINLLLAKTQNMVITPDTDPNEIERMVENTMDIWNDEKQDEEQRKILEDVQK